MSLVEINFDGIVGPSHNYAGLSLAISHRPTTPEKPAIRALLHCKAWKMRHNLALGLTQGFLLPLPDRTRPS